MAVRVKSFAEYAVRKWMAENGMSEKDFSIEMHGREAIVTDSNGDSFNLKYDSLEKAVCDC